MSTRKRGPAADAGHHCPVTDLSSVSARQRTPNGMGWPSYKTHHDLITQNRFFCQVLIIKETRGRRWPPLPPSICQSLTADTRGSASRRHTVTASYRRSCTPSPAPRGNVNKGRLVVSRLTSPPAIATDTASSLTGLACLIDCPPKRSQPTRNNIGREGGQRPLCYNMSQHKKLTLQKRILPLLLWGLEHTTF